MSSSPAKFPSIFTTPSSQKYSVHNAEHSYFYISPCKDVIESEKPLAVYVNRKDDQPSSDEELEMEWIRHSPAVALVYVFIALFTVAYYAACFLFQYGNYLPRSRANVFDEPFLSRVIIVQWLVLLVILTSGVFLYRRIFMPLYIFLAVMATNGTLVLFVLKLKQLFDERITIMDIPLNMIGLLLFCAVLHNIVYFYAMHLKMTESQSFAGSRFRCEALPNPYSSRITKSDVSVVDIV
uniref:Uncharacterized protein n=1 Tax=Caenorhabditis japonica TaxID=281687 RepID=A0A8R1I5X5_CAEJA